MAASINSTRIYPTGSGDATPVRSSGESEKSFVQQITEIIRISTESFKSLKKVHDAEKISLEKQNAAARIERLEAKEEAVAEHAKPIEKPSLLVTILFILGIVLSPLLKFIKNLKETIETFIVSIKNIITGLVQKVSDMADLVNHIGALVLGFVEGKNSFADIEGALSQSDGFLDNKHKEQKAAEDAAKTNDSAPIPAAKSNSTNSNTNQATRIAKDATKGYVKPKSTSWWDYLFGTSNATNNEENNTNSSGAIDNKKFDINKYMELVAIHESGNNWNSKPDFGFVGRYALGSQALEDAGYLKKGASKGRTKGRNAAIYDPSAWVNGWDVDKFLSSHEAQNDAYKKITTENYNRLKARGIITDSMSGAKVASILFGAAEGGLGGATKYFKQGRDTYDFYFGSKASVGKSATWMENKYEKGDPVDPKRFAHTIEPAPQSSFVLEEEENYEIEERSSPAPYKGYQRMLGNTADKPSRSSPFPKGSAPNSNNSEQYLWYFGVTA